MKNILFFLIIPLYGICQVGEPFLGLKLYKHDYLPYIEVYAPEDAEIINSKKAIQCDNWEPAYPLIRVKLNSKDSEKILVCVTDEPSDDDAFVFFREKAGKYEFINGIYGQKLYIPGNGNLYSVSLEYYNVKRKYQWNGSKIEEVPQPYYYVGLKTKCTKALILFSDYNCQNKLAVVPPNSEIEVLVSDKEEQKYLIKTPFGLVGWWPYEGKAFPEKETDNPIPGLWLRGD